MQVAAISGAVMVAIGLSSVPSAVNAQQTPYLGNWALPTCEPGDRVETGLDGQLTIAERTSGASKQPYNCNLEVVGSYPGQGAGHQMMWHNNCVYYTTEGYTAGAEDSTINPLIPPLIHNGGTQVLDISDLKNPKWVGHLMDPLYSWETAYVNQKRGLLIEAESWTGRGPQPALTIYDVSKDCTKPEMLFAGMFNDTWQAHAANVSTDGKTYYITGYDVHPQPGETSYHHLIAIDIKDPKNPKQIVNWTFPLNQAGNVFHRIQLNHHWIGDHAPDTLLLVGQSTSGGPDEGHMNGLLVVDVSDIQNRVANPTPGVIGKTFWTDGRTSIEPVEAIVGGVPFVIAGDEGGSAAPAAACAAGTSLWGYARMFDMSDPTNPKLVSYLKPNIVDPAMACTGPNSAINDIAPTAGGYGYSWHDSTVDNVDNAKLLAYSCHQCGVRVIDIHDPLHPAELAYFKGPAPPDPTQYDPGSLLTPQIGTTPPIDFAWTKSHSRFYWKGDQLYLMMISSHNAFYVLKFEPTVMKKILALNPQRVPHNNMPD